MPTNPEVQHVLVFAHSLTVATATNLTVQLQLYDDGQQEPGYMDWALQSLVDHMQAWEGKNPQSDVQGQKYDNQLFYVSPTNPVFPPEG